MTQSNSREQAKAAFGQEQLQYFARGKAMEELDFIAQSRDAKTIRLREARRAKEEQQLALAAAIVPKSNKVLK